MKCTVVKPKRGLAVATVVVRLEPTLVETFPDLVAAELKRQGYVAVGQPVLEVQKNLYDGIYDLRFVSSVEKL